MNEVSLLSDPRCIKFLKALAFRTHSQRLRDITPTALVSVLEDESCGLNKENPVWYFKMISMLQLTVYKGTCGLFTATQKFPDEDENDEIMKK